MNSKQTAGRNIAVLAAAQALGGASPPIVMSLGGLVGLQLASNPAWATFPVSLFGLGLAFGTLPAAAMMRRWGRRAGYVLGALKGILGGAVAALGIFSGSFKVFCLGTFIAGLYSSYVQSYRFAAADAAEGEMKTRAISRVMVGGLIGAIVGPQLVIWTRDALPPPFVGSFLSQAILPMIAIPVLLMLRTPRAEQAAQGIDTGRPLLEILRMPRYILAVATGVVSYGVMDFVMTAAPVAMVKQGYGVDNAALGIQWHLLAMFGPSFFTGRLMARFGKERVTAFGLVLLAGSGAVALSGAALSNFWGSLALLGVGWNFSFIGATAMVTDCHTPAERGKAQGANDFLVFGVTAIVSFLAGSVMHSAGWVVINWAILPALALMLVPLVWQASRAKVAP